MPYAPSARYSVALRGFARVALLLLLLSPASSLAQSEDRRIPGELIVHLAPDVSATAFAAQPALASRGLTPKRLLVPALNIWLVEFDVSGANTAFEADVLARATLDAVRSTPGVRVAQFNHRVDLRSAPVPANDTRFGEMWGLNNTGQNGGSPDADVDAPEAWDITTGGLSAGGDRIAIAVIDGGFALSHPDLRFWTNAAEVPGNGIDDDGNGYVDDVNGWNAYNSNGTITSSSHGTHVAGTAAARGNNSLGVTGINWDAEVIAIQGSSGSEATVIEAYGYALALRTQYDATDGAEGAFVVATNSSFGVDFGDPDDFPIWCGFYDELGAAGILSAAATANMNIDVDVQGDVPTACSSTYLLSVTNTTRDDLKNSGAAYGATTIDLGAPGTGILSTIPGGSYGTSTGTSMATPHVAGAVALMVSGLDPEQLQSYRDTPASWALSIKQALLDGTDPLGLETVSGGRLNLYNSLVLLGAATPTDPPTAAITPGSATLSAPPGGTDTFGITISEVGGSLPLSFEAHIDYGAAVGPPRLPARPTALRERTAKRKPTAGLQTPPAPRQTIHAGGADYLIWDPSGAPNDGEDVETILVGMGYTVDYVTDLAMVSTTDPYDAVFATLGTFPNAHVVTDAESAVLATYLDAGGRLYMEGGDTWFYDPSRPIHAYFSIAGLDDGASGGEVTQIDGAATTPFGDLNYGYDNAGSTYDNWIDHLGPAGDAFTAFTALLDGAPFNSAVAYNSGLYRTFGASTNFGGLVESGDDTRADYVAAILDWFGPRPTLWASLSATNGVIPAGRQGSLTFTADATDLPAGTHTVEVVISTNDPESPTYTIPVTFEVTAPPSGACPLDLVISDFQATPDDAEFIDLQNVGSVTIDFAAVDCVVGAFTSESYLGLPAAGTLAPGATLRFGASGAGGVDIPFPDGTLADASSGLALLDRESLPDGTPAADVQSDVVTSLVYLSDGTVYGFSHTDAALWQLYCSLYDGELAPYGQNTCLAITAPRGTAGDGGTTGGSDVDVVDFAAMIGAAANQVRTATTSETAAVPAAFALHAAYPNPFAVRARLAYDLPEVAAVQLVIYDVLGRTVAVVVDERAEAGRYEATLDASSLASGTYVVRLTAETSSRSFAQAQRFNVVR